MRSTAEKFRLPTALKEIVKARVPEAGYDTMSEYVLGLIRYDLLTRKPHPATAGIADLKRSEQDKIDDEIVAMFASNETLGGSWFEAKMKEAVEAAGKPEVNQPRVMRELLLRISGRRAE